MAKSQSTVEFVYPLNKLSGKTNKNENGYFRFQYGERRYVVTKPYVDNPTENQLNSRAAFGELRRRVSQEIHDPILGPIWQKKFDAEKKKLKDKFPYKLLQGYVYAEIRAGRGIQ